MKLLDNKSLAMGVVAIATIILQFPHIGEWYGRVSQEHTHVVTIVEGIFGVVMLFFATKKPDSPIAPGGQK